jgi:Ca2+-transporting ATPase
MVVIYVPLLNTAFRTAPLSAGQLLTCVAIASIVLAAVEFEKIARRQRAA